MNFAELILSALAALIALTLHEYAHGYAAKAAKQDIDASIRIWDLSPNLSLSATDTLALAQGRYHRIVKLTPTKDPDGLPVLDIDLADDDAAIRRKLV